MSSIHAADFLTLRPAARPATPMALMTMESPHPKEPLTPREVGTTLCVSTFVFLGIVTLFGIPHNIFISFIIQTTFFSGFYILFLDIIGDMFVYSCQGFDHPPLFSRENEKAARRSEILERVHAWMDSWRGLAILWIFFAMIGLCNDYAPLYHVLLATCCSIIVWLVSFRWTGQ